MRTLITALTLLLFLLFSLVSPVALHAQASGSPGRVVVSLYPAWDDEGYNYVEDYFRDSNLLGALAWETSTRWRLPHTIRLVGAQCGELRHSRQTVRRQEQVREQIIFVCYEQADSIFRLASRLTGTPGQKVRAASFVLSWMIFDQLSYALVSAYGLPDDSFEQFTTDAQHSINRIADHLAMIALDEARAGGPLDQFVRDAKASNPQVRALLRRALLTMGTGEDEDITVAGAQERALLCWMRTGAEASPVRPACAQEMEVAQAARNVFPAAHSVPPGSRPAADYDFQPDVAVTPTPVVRRARRLPPLPDTDGSWRFRMEVRRLDSPCHMDGYLTFLPSSPGEQRGAFEGMRYCDGLRPADRLFMSDTVAIIRTSTTVHFTSEECMFSGVVQSSGTDVWGSLRCGTVPRSGGSTTTIRGRWSSSPGEPITARQREEWASAQGRLDARRLVETSPRHAAARARFQGYDIARDGSLRGVELMRCDCHAADHNGDGDVTLEEYVQPRGSVTRTYRLVQIAGRPLPYQAPDGSGEVLNARFTLYSTGVIVYRLTGREPGGPDTTAVFTGRYQLENDQFSMRIPPFPAATGRITGTDLRVRMGPDGEWMLWRRVSAPTSMGGQRAPNRGEPLRQGGLESHLPHEPTGGLPM